MKKRYEYTKTPLDYQITEYDCGTTTLFNALRYLFKRDEISPEVYKFIMQYTLDNTNSSGEIGKGGTSIYSLNFISEWLNINSANKGMKMTCENLKKDEISMYNPKLEEKIKKGAVAILRIYQEYEHYCLLTKLDKEYAYVFDPYYLNINYYDNDDDVEIIKNKPFEFNRKVRRERMEEKTKKDFALVRSKNAQIIIIEKKND